MHVHAVAPGHENLFGIIVYLMHDNFASVSDDELVRIWRNHIHCSLTGQPCSLLTINYCVMQSRCSTIGLWCSYRDPLGRKWAWWRCMKLMQASPIIKLSWLLKQLPAVFLKACRMIEGVAMRAGDTIIIILIHARRRWIQAPRWSCCIWYSA